MQLALEDNVEDVLGKAQRGLGLSDEDICKDTGLSAAQWQALLAGEPLTDELRKAAAPLQLKAGPLIALAEKRYQPAEHRVEGLLCFNTPYPIPGYEEMTVNAYLAYDPETKEAVAFDTGGDATPMVDAIQAHGLDLKLILITHADSDHIADLPRLKRETDEPPTFTDYNEPVEGAEPVGEGAFFSVGGLGILAAETSGHSPGQLSYIIQGLSKPVAVVGDSLFAGSIGGAPNAWKEAIENCRKKLLSLDPQTILCPGHGPLTSVAEEVVNNPILAA